jgi:hypothetical protein
MRCSRGTSILSSHRWAVPLVTCSEFDQVAHYGTVSAIGPNTMFPLSRKSLVSTVLLLAAVLGNSLARPANLDECAQRAVAFDGIASLSYAAVTADVGSKVYLHAQYPTDCNAEASGDGCKGTAYLLSGDAVAVGKTCGAWAYVQYIGEKRISVGWLPTNRIMAASAGKPPASSAAPESGDQRRYHFALTKGHGTPVCEAYLQRLNQTPFGNPPYCGRPESTVVPGFALLQRRWMARSDYIRLFIYVDSFLQNSRIEDFYVHRKMPDGRDVFGPPGDDIFPGFVPSVWLYDPRVDIDNDGTTAEVAIWNEDDRNNPRCLQYVGNQATAARSPQPAVILKADDTGIDIASTKAIFGYGDGALPSPTGSTEFRPLGTEVGVLRFRGVTYFDTFLSGSGMGHSHAERQSAAKLRDTLGVFLRRDHRTQQMCEYYVSDQGD